MTRDPSSSSRTPDAIDRYDELVRDAGADPGALSGKLVREMVHTAVKLFEDGAHNGELKLASRSLKELRYALKIFRAYAEVPKLTVFGSARTPEAEPAYRAAEALGRRMAEAGWMVITGAGGGIMRAAQGGAGRDASFGVAIRLPFETTANEFIEGDRKLIVFRYFFTRKLIFASQAQGVVLLPGGFGTQDECFEILTLIQTGKAPVMPVVMLDEPGGGYWREWEAYVRRQLLGRGLIDPDDRRLYEVTDDPEDAAERVRGFYRNYHSQRFAGDELVLRLRRPLTEAQVEAINAEFAELVAEGRIAATGPHPAESAHFELPRLRFVFTRRDHGRLRQLIDRINADDAANHPEAIGAASTDRI